MLCMKSGLRRYSKSICVHVFEFVLGIKHYKTRTALAKNALIHNERVLNSED